MGRNSRAEIRARVSSGACPGCVQLRVRELVSRGVPRINGRIANKRLNEGLVGREYRVSTETDSCVSWQTGPVFIRRKDDDGLFIGKAAKADWIPYIISWYASTFVPCNWPAGKFLFAFSDSPTYSLSHTVGQPQRPGRMVAGGF